MATVVKDLGPVTAYGYAKEQGYAGTEEEYAELMADYARVGEAAAAAAAAAAGSAADAATAQGKAETAQAAAENAQRATESEAADAIPAIQSEGTKQVTAVGAAGTQQIAAVDAAGTQQIGLVTAEGTAQIGNVEAAGEAVLESIPADYSAMSADVEGLKREVVVLSGDIAGTRTTVSGLYLNAGKLAAITGDDRTICIEAEPDRTYRIKKATSTVMRAGCGSAADLAAGASLTSFVQHDTASADALRVTTDAVNHYIYIQLFGNNDAADFKSIDANVATLQVLEDVQSEAGELKTAVESVRGGEAIAIPCTVTSGFGVRYDTGNLVTSDSFGYTDYIDVRLYDAITVTRINLTATSVNTGIAFYDRDKTFLWGVPSVRAQASGGYFTDTIRLPENVAFVRCTVLKSNVGGFSIVGSAEKAAVRFGAPFEPFCPFIALQTIDCRTGATARSDYYTRTDFVYCRGFDILRYTRVVGTVASTNFGLAFYDANMDFIGGSGQPFGVGADTVHTEITDIRVPVNATWVRMTYYNQTYIESNSLPDFSAQLIKIGTLENRIGRADGETPAIAGLYPYKPESRGIENAIRRAHALARLKWTPVGDIIRQMKFPNGNVGTAHFKAGVTYIGSPYSVTHERKRNIGIEISIETFLSIVGNAGTRIYDTSAGMPTNYAYYGNVCSSFVAYAVGMMTAPLTEVMGEAYGMQLTAPSGAWNEKALRLGSILLDPDNHVVLVTGILTDADGAIRFIEITEATLNGYIQSGKVIAKWYTPEQLMTRFSGYGLYWYNYIDDCDYRQSNYAQVFPEPESAESEKYACVSAFGDGAVFGSNTQTAPVCIDSGAYEAGFRALQVYLNGELVGTYDINSDTSVVEVPKQATGEYYLILTGDGIVSRPTRWHVYANTFSKAIDGTTLTLTYDTDATVFGISYVTQSTRIFCPCHVTGSGTVTFEVADDASSVNVIFGDKNGAVHKSI